MADDADETGKKDARPGDPPAAKRPFATIDLKATEVAGEGHSTSAASAGSASATSQGWSTTDRNPEAKAAAADARGTAAGAQSQGDPAKRATGGARLMSSLAGQARAAPFLTNLAAGAIGAVVVLAVTYAFTPEPAPAPARAPEVGELNRRLSELEGVIGTRPGTAGLRARVDEVSRSIAALGNAQAKLSRDAKELEDRIGSGKDAPSELAGRIAKLEQGIASAPASGDQTAGQSQPPIAQSAKMAELEKAAQEANDAAKSAASRLSAELAALRTEAGRLSQRVDGIKGEVEERMQGAARAADFTPITRRLAALEQELQGLTKTDAGRRADAGRIVLALELAALRRAVDRGDSYAAELAAVKSAGGSLVDLVPLERYMREGVSPVRDLQKSFPSAANAMLDAEAARSDASLVDRLISSARSIVRVRKLGHAADDASADAIIARMESALKEERLGEVIEQAKKLPPKAALASEDWLKRLEARQSVDQAMAEVESALKASLGSARAGGLEPRR